MEQEDPNIIRIGGVDALRELEAATKNVAKALSMSVEEYAELREKYEALEETVKSGAAHAHKMHERGGGEEFALVMIDAYNNELTDLFLRCGAATQNYTLEDAVVDYIQKNHPGLAPDHMTVQIYADYGLLAAAPVQSGQNEDVQVQRPLVHLLSTSGAYFDFVNVTSEKDVAQKMHQLTAVYRTDLNCTIFFSTSHGSSYWDTLLDHPKYMSKITDISTDFATLLIELAEGKLPSWTPAGSHSNVDQVLNITSEEAVESDDGLAQRKGSCGSFENNQYVPRPPPKSAIETLKTPEALSQPPESSTAIFYKPGAGLIPINSAGQRINTFLRTPSEKEHSAYKRRTRVKSLCSRFHLSGRCWTKNCHYDHSPIDDSLFLVLKHKLLARPCRFEGACREKDCIYGHVCVRKGCAGNRDKGCKFSSATHGVDVEVAAWVEPVKSNRWMDKEKEGMSMAHDTNSSMSSMENWPTMGNLIDI